VCRDNWLRDLAESAAETLDCPVEIVAYERRETPVAIIGAVAHRWR
jgi:hypothetical protein